MRELSENTSQSDLEYSHPTSLYGAMPYDLKYGAYDGSNAYLVIYDGNGKVYYTKQLDESYFTFHDNSNVYTIDFFDNGTDGSNIDYMFDNHKDLKTDIDLYMYFNSDEGLVGLKIPVKYANRESYSLTVN